MSRYELVSRRPLELALAIRSGAPLITFQGQNVTLDRKQLFAQAVPVVLDQVSDWWDSVGKDRWPDERLTSMGRLPWPVVWAEWRERTVGNVMCGILLQEEPFSSQVDSGGLRGDYIVWATWFSKHPASGARVVVAPTIGWLALANGEKVRRGDETPFFTKTKGWPFHPQDILGTFAVWNLFTALLTVRGSVAQDVAIPRPSRRQFARVNDGIAPWVHYKTLSVDLHLPSDTPTASRPHATVDRPRGVPLHLVRGNIADYRHGNGLFGKYKGLVWRPMHRRGYQRLGVVAKTYEAGEIA